eukprot:2455653-Rhodomonas_salina.1
MQQREKEGGLCHFVMLRACSSLGYTWTRGSQAASSAASIFDQSSTRHCECNLARGVPQNKQTHHEVGEISSTKGEAAGDRHW